MLAKNIFAKLKKQSSMLLITAAAVVTLVSCQQPLQENEQSNNPVFLAYKNTYKQIEKENEDLTRQISDKSAGIKNLTELFKDKVKTVFQYNISKDKAKDLPFLKGLKLKDDTIFYISNAFDKTQKTANRSVKIGLENPKSNIWLRLFVNDKKEIGITSSFANTAYGFNWGTLLEDYMSSELKNLSKTKLSELELHAIMKQIELMLAPAQDDKSKADKFITEMLSKINFKDSGKQTIKIGEMGDEIETTRYVGTFSNEKDKKDILDYVLRELKKQNLKLDLNDLEIYTNIAENRIYSIGVNLLSQDGNKLEYMLKLGSKDKINNYYEISIRDGRSINLKSVVTVGLEGNTLAYRLRTENNGSEVNVGLKIDASKSEKERIQIFVTNANYQNIDIRASMTTDKDKVLLKLDNLNLNGTDMMELQGALSLKFDKAIAEDLRVENVDFVNVLKAPISELTKEFQNVYIKVILAITDFISII